MRSQFPPPPHFSSSEPERGTVPKRLGKSIIPRSRRKWLTWLERRTTHFQLFRTWLVNLSSFSCFIEIAVRLSLFGRYEFPWIATLWIYKSLEGWISDKIKLDLFFKYAKNIFLRITKISDWDWATFMVAADIHCWNANFDLKRYQTQYRILSLP